MPKLSLPCHADVVQAQQRINSYIVKTPVLTNLALNQQLGCELFFKCENLQRTGAFKFRGATNALLKLTQKQRQQGVITVSSGNHGAALAHAGKALGINVKVGVPTNAPAIKRQNMEAGDADITDIEPGMEAREAIIAQWLKEGESHFIPPYDHADIIAGQGTATLELLEQTDGLDAVITPLGGGGLLSGACLACDDTEVQIFGAEPELANDAWLSLKAGERQPALPAKSLCDGLLTQVGELPFAIIQQRISDILVLKDEDTLKAMELIWRHLKIVVEPSSAIALAAVMQNLDVFHGKRVGLVLSGGNVAAQPESETLRWSCV
ncbi:threonine/serine dehydratase [Idiomarina sp. HP20-50]|uniref:threonine/serine dehydratase n=1 Tax=Idiomarina sp. HP20-50 TaxID=3070813 RepID=UPI00294B58FB|nr:threonine/serine dehydratase [Idiomarina sp. HP20-50]MDV6316295.1 threonine/serine dehydratase [Idiomarina sp. HP20-50]